MNQVRVTDLDRTFLPSKLEFKFWNSRVRDKSVLQTSFIFGKFAGLDQVHVTDLVM